MEKFAFGQMGLSTEFDKASISNVEFAGLAAESQPFDAYSEFADLRFVGVTKCLVLLTICLNGAAELTIDVEINGSLGIVEKSNVSFRRVLR